MMSIYSYNAFSYTHLDVYKRQPYILSAKTGAVLEYDSFGSSWIMTAIVYYMKITGDYT